MLCTVLLGSRWKHWLKHYFFFHAVDVLITYFWLFGFILHTDWNASCEYFMALSNYSSWQCSSISTSLNDTFFNFPIIFFCLYRQFEYNFSCIVSVLFINTQSLTNQFKNILALHFTGTHLHSVAALSISQSTSKTNKKQRMNWLICVSYAIRSFNCIFLLWFFFACRL